MIDKTTKLLLAVIAGALCLLLLRSAVGPTPALAQEPVAPQTAPIMVTDKGLTYVLQNGTLSVYTFNLPSLKNVLPDMTNAKLQLLNSVKVVAAH